MFVVTYRKIFYSISAILVVGSLAVFLMWGLKFGIDFTGGSLIDVQYTGGTVPSVTQITEELNGVGIVGSSVRPSGTNEFLIRTPFLDGEHYTLATKALAPEGVTIDVKEFNSIGPSIGSELTTRALYAIVLVLLAIALFIAFAFRKVSKPVSSWKYGLVALISLAHDVVIPLGAFVLLGHFFGAEVDTLFVTALLVVLGFSVHDTIVVFDRVRENLRKLDEKGMKEDFELTVGRSIQQTFGRSINTSLTTVLALLALYFFGAEPTHYFALTLLIGIIAGTYSSVFIGSPLLVTLQKMQKEKVEDKNKKKK
jgi:preprotein translocase subunit SecF